LLLVVMGLYFPLWVWCWVNGNLFQALGGMKLRSRAMLLNAAVNLTLSVLLVRRFGVVGVSVGSLVAMACTEAIIVPRLLGRRLRELAASHGAPAVERPADGGASGAVPSPATA
jgi:O-antigen/teichoic acid export membrane protein